MITTAQEYNSNLHLVNNANPPIFAQLPAAENIYNIDVNTRKIDPPQFLSVEKDHVSETIYFIVDRYADYMDLADTSCVIYYISADGKCRLYKVPFYDIFTYASENKMLLPWCLDQSVAIKEGTVEFAIQFFKLDREFDGEGHYIPVVTYSLNTLPSKSRVLKGIQLPDIPSDEEWYFNNETNSFVSIVQGLINEVDYLKDSYSLKWTLLD